MLEKEEGGPQYKSSESVLGAMIFIESEVSIPCALVLCFPFFGHILRNADPSSSEERRVFRNLSSVFFSSAFSESGSSTELVHPVSTE